MSGKPGIARVDLPADARPDTLAVREGLPAGPWGENSEALFLTSGFVRSEERRVGKECRSRWSPYH